ncbi:MAG TPA: sigma-70 family RNA polymerase sigma factor [Thermoanaerobaculia bacterium]|nr:sigma-70 family RNA polymerase sigma factor [Thermoanaerobaculia bacterium]
MAAVRAMIVERSPRGVPAHDPEATYLQHLSSMERIAAHTAHRNHLTADELAEFVQIVRVRLFEDDYRIIRKFEGRSTFSTFVTVVILRLFNEWRAEQWGKWRPSAQARALGEKAIALERLLSRDGLSFPEAVAVLTQRHPRSFSVDECDALYARLPLRKARPVFLTDENALEGLPSQDSADERVRAGEREITSRSVLAALDQALGGFSPDERLMLQLRFRKGMTAPEIAPIMRLEPKQVYKRLQRLFKMLQRALVDQGIDAAAIRELMDQAPLDLSLESRPERTPAPKSASGRKEARSNSGRRVF